MVEFVIQMLYLIGFYFSRQTLWQSKVVVVQVVLPFTTADAGTPAEEAEDVEWPPTPELAAAIQKPLTWMQIWLCIILNVVSNSK